jgi:hypothetical protein
LRPVLEIPAEENHPAHGLVRQMLTATSAKRRAGNADQNRSWIHGFILDGSLKKCDGFDVSGLGKHVHDPGPRQAKSELVDQQACIPRQACRMT